MQTTTFSTLADFRIVLGNMEQADQASFDAATTRNGQLTKPPGALGRLEELAIWYAAWRGQAAPKVSHPQAVIFAGNHGVVAQGVSAFPAEVTVQMVANFQHGGAAINQLCRAFGTKLDVIALELDRPTADFTTAPAMTEAEVCTAISIGWNAVDPQADLFVTGEMGIGNTTSASAILAALYGGNPQDWVGRGTGVDDAGLARKAGAVRRGLALHAKHLDDPLMVLACLGGREIAAMAGAIARARAMRIPVLLDGFICCAAAAVLAQTQTGALAHCVAAHASTEAGHQMALKSLGLDPILSLGMRLGEGSGAALAVGILKAALECHSGMATFAEAGVTQG